MSPPTEKYQHDNRDDHRAILDELKRLREDFKEVILVTKEEQRRHREEVRGELNALSESVKSLVDNIHAIDLKSQEALNVSKDNKSVIWKVGGTAVVVACTAVAKSLGFI